MRVCPSSSENGSSSALLRLLAGILLFLLCGFVGLTIVRRVRPASDGGLASRFVKQSNEIERLVSVVRNAPQISIVQRHANSNGILLAQNQSGQTIPLSALSNASLELPRLFDIVDCDYVSRNPSEFTIAFRRNGIEDLYPGGIKVIAFCSIAPTSIVSSIDDFRRKNRGRYGVYQSLGGSWFIKYEEAH